LELLLSQALMLRTETGDRAKEKCSQPRLSKGLTSLFKKVEVLDLVQIHGKLICIGRKKLPLLFIQVQGKYDAVKVCYQLDSLID